MAFAFDTLGYAKRLRDAGVSEPEAEAHAEAAREFIMAELATRYDLDVLRRELEQRIDSAIGALRHDTTSAIGALRHDTTSAIGALRQDTNSAIGALRQDTTSSVTSLRHELEVSVQRLESRIDSLELRLMVRLGGLIAIGVAILAAIIKF